MPPPSLNWPRLVGKGVDRSRRGGGQSLTTAAAAACGRSAAPVSVSLPQALYEAGRGLSPRSFGCTRTSAARDRRHARGGVMQWRLPAEARAGEIHFILFFMSRAAAGGCSGAGPRGDVGSGSWAAPLPRASATRRKGRGAAADKRAMCELMPAPSSSSSLHHFVFYKVPYA